MSSVDGNAVSADKPGEKQKALCVATRCTSIEQFVATFHRFCDETSFFVATLATRPVGLETAFSIQLEDKTPVLRGLCVVVEAWSTPANRFGRPGVRLDVRRLTNDSITVFKQLQQARSAAEAATPSTDKQKAMHDPAAAQAAFDAAANAAMDLIASEAAAAAKESKAALEAAGKRAMTEAESVPAAVLSPASIAAKPEPPPLMPKGTRDAMPAINPKATQAIGALLKTPATPAAGTPTTKTPVAGTPTSAAGAPSTKTPPIGKPIVSNAFPAKPANDPPPFPLKGDAPVVAAKSTKQMPPMPPTKFSTQPIPRLKDGATPPAGSPTPPPPVPGMKVTPPTAIPVVRAVPDVSKIEGSKVRAEGTAPVAKETVEANANERAASESTAVDSESFDEKTVDVENKLAALVESTRSDTQPVVSLIATPKSDPQSLAEKLASTPTGAAKPLVAKQASTSTSESQPIELTKKVSSSGAPKVITPSAPKRPEETRTPGSAFVLPANPLMNLTDASLEGFIDCALYEETGNFYRAEDEGLVDVGDLVQPPLPNQLSPIQALRPGDVSDRQPSYIGPMPQQSYMGPMPSGGTYPPPMQSGTYPPPMQSGTYPPPTHTQSNGLSPTAFNARRAASEAFSPEATPIPMLLGAGFAQQLENAARDTAATTPPPIGPPETRTNWTRPETPDPFNTPQFARVDLGGRVETQPMFGRAESVTGAFLPQRGGRYATGQFPPQPLTSGAPEVAPGTHPLVGPGAMANGAPHVDANGYPSAPAFAQPGVDANGYPSAPAFAQPAPNVDANGYPSAPAFAQPGVDANGYPVAPAMANGAPNVDANGYPVEPAFAQPGFPPPQPNYATPPHGYPSQLGFPSQPSQPGFPPQPGFASQPGSPQPYAPQNPAMQSASLPSTPLTPRPRRERTQMTSTVNPRRWRIIAGSAAIATAAIVAIVVLATRGDKKDAVAATAPTTKLATTETHKIDTNVAKPSVAVVKPSVPETKPATKIDTKVETKPETKIAPKTDDKAIATGNDATVARPETKIEPRVAPPPADDATDPDEASESDAPPVVGSGPCRVEIATTPAGSIVKVDDHTVGPSPVTVAGPCKKTKIEVNHARYAATTKWVSPTETAPANVDVQLSRPTHAVTVTSSPAGATVFIGGRRAGTTPTSVSLMGFTTQTLKFEKKGYATVTQKFYSKKANDRVSVTMKKGK